MPPFRRRVEVLGRFFQKAVGSRGNAPVALRRGRNSFTLQKDQEGRGNSPVDCCLVGNPIQGFPDAARAA